MVKRILFFSMCMVFGVMFSAFAQEGSQPEEISITTYYPSPYGVYNELQLYPHSIPVTPCDSTTKGTTYYDSDDNQVKTCNGVGQWVNIGDAVAGTLYGVIQLPLLSLASHCSGFNGCGSFSCISDPPGLCGTSQMEGTD